MQKCHKSQTKMITANFLRNVIKVVLNQISPDN